MLSETAQRLSAQGPEITFSEEVYALLAEKSNGRMYGARNLRGVITRELETPLAELLISDCPPVKIRCTVKEGRVAFEAASAPDG